MDEEEHLEQIMDSGAHKLLDGHVIESHNILLLDHYLEPNSSQGLTPQKSVRGSSKIFGRGNCG